MIRAASLLSCSPSVRVPAGTVACSYEHSQVNSIFETSRVTCSKQNANWGWPIKTIASFPIISLDHQLGAICSAHGRLSSQPVSWNAGPGLFPKAPRVLHAISTILVDFVVEFPLTSHGLLVVRNTSWSFSNIWPSHWQMQLNASLPSASGYPAAPAGPGLSRPRHMPGARRIRAKGPGRWPLPTRPFRLGVTKA